jgi:hypothetical protein
MKLMPFVRFQTTAKGLSDLDVTEPKRQRSLSNVLSIFKQIIRSIWQYTLIRQI